MATQQVERLADALTAQLVGGYLTGVDVVVSDVLPIAPSWAEWCRRFTRHQWGAEYLRWMGEDVGPEPDDAAHGFTMTVPGIGPRLYLSAEVYALIVDVLTVTHPRA